MTTNSSVYARHVQGEIEFRIDRGADLLAVERSIDADSMLSGDEKEHLKTWAWAWYESRPRVSTQVRRVVTLIPSLQ